MKRLLALVAGGLGLRALLRRRPRGAVLHSPAEDLRARLARAKGAEPEPAAVPAVEPPVAQPAVEPPAVEQTAAEQPASVEERRADVHAKARRAIDDLGAP